MPQALLRRAHRLAGLAGGAQRAGRSGTIAAAGCAAGAPPSVAGEGERLPVLQAAGTASRRSDSLTAMNCSYRLQARGLG